MYKKYSNTDLNDRLWDSYLEKAETTATEYGERSVWDALYSFQDEANKTPTSEVRKLQEAINRLKAENLTDDIQHNKDVKTLLAHLTENKK